MDFRYDDIGDANQQLDGCIMLTDKGEVVKLAYAGQWEYEVKDLINKEREIKDIREVGLSFAPLELGYVNGRYGLSYLVRNPIRMWKAGVTYENTKAIRGSLEDGVMNDPSIANCILNVYPSMADAYTRAKGDAVELAFHKDFAFHTKQFPQLGLEYKGVDIGFVNEELNLEIEDRYVYVREILEEIVNGKG